MSEEVDKEVKVEIELPYEQITNPATFVNIREHSGIKRGSREVFMIELDSIMVRDGFNVRYVLGDIRSLANDIKAVGLQMPITVDVLVDGRIFVEKGHRRLEALRLLKTEGVDLGRVECFINKRDITELQRLINIHSSNSNQEPLKPLEQAELAGRLKRYHELSHDNIAKILGVSRQTVDNRIAIYEEPDDIKQAIKDGNMNMSAAMAHIQMIKDANKRHEVIRTTLASVGKVTKDTLAKEMKELFDLENSDAPDAVQAAAEQQEKEEKTFDASREEIAWCNNIIGLTDKLTLIADKLPEGTSKDIADIAKWIQNDGMKVRDWVHKNKKR